MWKLLSADYCHLNDLAVPLLIYSLLYESGRNAFWSLVDRDFKDPSWKVRMQAGWSPFYFYCYLSKDEIIYRFTSKRAIIFVLIKLQH